MLLYANARLKRTLIIGLRSRNNDLVRRAPSLVKQRRNRSDGFPSTEFIYSVAEECFKKNHIYPISFSWPGRFIPRMSQKSSTLCSIVPYEAYSFEDSEKYYETYSSSELAITQKKGGWDCFRHLEIIVANSVPLFLNSSRIPKYSMIHYPKAIFRQIEDDYLRHSIFPSSTMSGDLIHYAKNNLTSEAMCRYISKLSNIDLKPNEGIMFIDSKLSSEPDYLSIFNFIGFKKLYGHKVFSLFEEPDYVYIDTLQDTHKLYGHGFGYTKVLEREKRMNVEISNVKYVLISNLERDFDHLAEFRSRFPHAIFLLFWGGDSTIPKKVKSSALQITDGTIFCREI